MVVGATHEGVTSLCRLVLDLAFAAAVELRGTLANSIVVDFGVEVLHFGMDIGFEFAIWEELIVVSFESSSIDSTDMACMGYTESSHV